MLKQWLRRTLRGDNLVNDGSYWDRYARNHSGGVIGKEWKNEEIFLRMLEAGASGRALEIGCGGGRITGPASRWFQHVHACDVSKEMLRSHQREITAPNISRHLIDGFTLKEFADESVDTVFSHDVFVHFSSLQIYPYLLEIKRVLKSGGRGLLSFYNFHRHFELFKEMALRFNREKVYPPHMRVHFVTRGMIELMLSDLAMSVLSVDEENFLIVLFAKRT